MQVLLEKTYFSLKYGQDDPPPFNGVVQRIIELPFAPYEGLRINFKNDLFIVRDHPIWEYSESQFVCYDSDKTDESVSLVIERAVKAGWTKIDE